MSENPSHDQPMPSAEETRHGDHTRPASGSPPERPRSSRPRQHPGSASSSGTRRQYSRQRAAAPPPPVTNAPPPIPVHPSRPPSQRHQERVPPSQSGLYFPWWSLLIMVATVGTVAFGLLLAFTQLSEPAAPGDQIPRIQVITSQPTLSQDFGSSEGQAAAPPGGAWPTAIPQAQPSPTVPLPTPVPTQTLPPGDFEIGTQVQVIGVEATKLNGRATPGLDGGLVFLAEDGEYFAIVGGPQEVDGYEWWKLEDPANSARVGWAARNFLTIASQ